MARCVGIRMVLAGLIPLRRCAEQARKDDVLCPKCAKYAGRHAVLSAILVPDWEQRAKDVLAGRETSAAPPPPSKTELPEHPAQKTRRSLRWWEN